MYHQKSYCPSDVSINNFTPGFWCLDWSNRSLGPTELCAFKTVETNKQIHKQTNTNKQTNTQTNKLTQTKKHKQTHTHTHKWAFNTFVGTGPRVQASWPTKRPRRPDPKANQAPKPSDRRKWWLFVWLWLFLVVCDCLLVFVCLFVWLNLFVWLSLSVSTLVTCCL